MDMNMVHEEIWRHGIQRRAGILLLFMRKMGVLYSETDWKEEGKVSYKYFGWKQEVIEFQPTSGSIL